MMMGRVDVIVGRLREAVQHIRQLDRAMIQDPTDFGLQLAAQSMRQTEIDLRQALSECASVSGIPLCDYRLIPAAGEPSLTAFTSTLNEFQRLFALVFQAKTTETKKKQARTSGEYRNIASFGIAYTYSGSLGVVLSLPQAQALFQADELDAAMSETLTMAKCTSSDQIKHFAEAYGPAIIRALYSWSDAHLRNNVSPIISWRDDHDNSLTLTSEQLDELTLAIRETSDAKTETAKVVGELQAASVRNFKFEILADDGRLISGTMDRAISEHQTLGLPKRYTATIETQSQTNYATDENILKYKLLRLVEL